MSLKKINALPKAIRTETIFADLHIIMHMLIYNRQLLLIHKLAIFEMSHVLKINTKLFYNNPWFNYIVLSNC